MRKTKFAYVLAFAPVLMGAGYYAADEIGSTDNALIAMSLPKCDADQFLSYSAGGLTCTAISGGTVSVPECNSAGQLLTFTSSGEFAKFSCTDKGQTALSSTDITTVNNLYQKLVMLGTTLTTIEKTPRASAAVYVGNTQVTTPGRIDAGGTDIGIAGAVKLCTNQYGAGAHMCTIYDIYTSITSGTIVSGTDIPKAWVYQASWNNPAGAAGATKEPTAGLNENCAGYTYKTGDQSWVGTAFSYAKVTYNNNYAPKFYSGSADAACSAVLPVACCK
jgi:hypothetical protein